MRFYNRCLKGRLFLEQIQAEQQQNILLEVFGAQIDKCVEWNGK